MKKLLGIALVLALMVTMCFSTVAFAYGPDNPDDVVTVDWSGSGWVGANVGCGDDATFSFDTSGNSIAGSFSATDNNYDYYGYGVDTCWSGLTASVGGGGYIDFDAHRTDSTGSYGGAGQHSYAYVSVDDGFADMAVRSWTNFAEMHDCTWGNQLPSGHNIVVGSTNYMINRGISDGRGNWADLYAVGNGVATLDCMSAEASGCWNLELGRGCGCFIDANFTATGAGGQFGVGGTANTGATFAGMGMSFGSGAYGFVAPWTGSFSIADYSVVVD